MPTNKSLKNILILLSPLLLFAVLVLPYGWLNSEVLVDVFGCGCPQINEYGEIVHPTFSANNFTAIFWCAVTLCVTVAAVFLAIKRIPQDKLWLRVVYPVGMLAISIFITYFLYQAMMWN